VVQALLSSQLAELLAKVQPDAGLHESVVQGLLSLHVSAPEPTQAPFWQTSAVVQALLSLQAAELGEKTHPASGSHVSLVHGLLSLQRSALAPTQVPPAQSSTWVQALSSLQGLVLFVNTQPCAGRHASSVQGLPSAQASAAPPAQTPAAQASSVVQASPSSHGATTGRTVQPTAESQLSAVHGLESLQSTRLPDWHAPAAQTSPSVQKSPSWHGSEFTTTTQPEAGSQDSVVHGFESAQSTRAPGIHWPLSQRSPWVHAFSSLQGNGTGS
jgi:hypothetical protein